MFMRRHHKRDIGETAQSWAHNANTSRSKRSAKNSQ